FFRTLCQIAGQRSSRPANRPSLAGRARFERAVGSWRAVPDPHGLIDRSPMKQRTLGGPATTQPFKRLAARLCPAQELVASAFYVARVEFAHQRRFLECAYADVVG